MGHLVVRMSASQALKWVSETYLCLESMILLDSENELVVV